MTKAGYFQPNEPDDGPDELQMVYDDLQGAQAENKRLHAALRAEIGTNAKRQARMEADLLECLEYFKDKYDVNDGDYGEPEPNKEMALGTMIQCTLYGEGNF